MKAKACARKGKISYQARKKLPSKAFALPALRKYPLYKQSGGKLVPSASHARNALARAAQQLNAGHITAKQHEQVVVAAMAVLAKCGGGRKNPAKLRKNPMVQTTSDRKVNSVVRSLSR